MKKPILLTALGAAACAAPAAAREQPNILVILADDMGYSDIGCYGGLIRTPNLDSLAAHGLRYTQFYNTARSCPSRASLLTGLHPHQTGIGHMAKKQHGEEGYRGDLNDRCVTIAEVLRTTGYATYAVGKWHVTNQLSPSGAKDNWPLQRGFDHFYGTIMGGGSYYDPATLCRGNDYITPENDPAYRPETFYYTDAIADNALQFLATHHDRQAGKPFFMYMAFTAAHWPMQVPEEEAASYHGVFDKGWDELRREKYHRMRQSGLLDPSWALSTDETVVPWRTVQNKDFEIRCMEVYAGIVSRMDRNIGRVVEWLRRQGMLDNTIILFLQDNGGCAEGMERQRPPFKVRVPQGETLAPMAPDELQTLLIPFKTRDGRPMRRGQVEAGGADTYVAYGKGWAHLSDTPFREYKHWVHEGGIATPLIVHWPAGITARGELRKTPGQLPDIMATCVDLAGAHYPESYGDKAITPCEGTSLAGSFEDDTMPERDLFWEHEGNRAVRSGRWKLVYKASKGRKQDIPLSAWELYDLKTDRTECRDIAAERPRLVLELARKWEAFAERCQVKPWPTTSKTPAKKQTLKISEHE